MAGSVKEHMRACHLFKAGKSFGLRAHPLRSQPHQQTLGVCAAQMGGGESNGPEVSKRILGTTPPVIVQTEKLMRGVSDVMSLAQGVVHWQPPPSAMMRASESLKEGAIHSYGPCQGLPALRDALKQKLSVENGLNEVEVMITAGANQAFMNVILSTCDANDKVVLFVPYYFNHLMALQMTEGGPSVCYGPCDPATFLPDTGWLKKELESSNPPKAVVVITPNNPTGVIVPKDMLEDISLMCSKAKSWLVVDNTYENFSYGSYRPTFIEGPNIINIFSFSKCYGMMGWRMGYITYDKENSALGEALLKVQDTIPICATQISQFIALGALEAGRPWIDEKVALLDDNLEMVKKALHPLGKDAIFGGQGAIYLWARLPEGVDDTELVERLVKEYKVCVIPGSSCGAPGHIRVAYANLKPEKCKVASERLLKGLSDILL